MTAGQDFRLRSSEIVQILGDEKFFQNCVAFLFMRDQALQAVQQYRNAVVAKAAGCDGCDQRHADESRYVRGVIATFVKTVRELHAIDPAHLEPVRRYIAGQLGFSPDTILLYYKEAGATRSIKF